MQNRVASPAAIAENNAEVKKQNNPVNQVTTATALSQLSDDDAYSLIVSSRSVDMPNHIADIADDTQKFVFKANLNEKPTVLDSKAFKQYMKDNNITQGEIMARSVNAASYHSGGVNYSFSADQINDMVKYGKYNYIGGKRGGQVYGAGTYFEMNGGHNTGYGRGATMRAVLSKNARVISEHNIPNAWKAYTAAHPKVATAGHIPRSVKALLMGYNVITTAGGNSRSAGNGQYYNVIDRSALVIEK